MADENSGENTQSTGASFAERIGGLVNNDPRMQQFAAIEEPSDTDRQNARMTGMEVQLEMRDRIDQFKMLNPDASDSQALDYVEAVYANDLATVDKINKAVHRTTLEKEKESKDSAKKSVDLQSQDSSSGEGTPGEDMFTGKGAWDRAKALMGLS